MRNKMRFLLQRAVIWSVALLPTGIALPADSSAPVVVELFTSESCSSCPPAEAYLGTLAQRPDVLALSFHVDYWNDLGWVDRFSSSSYSSRQRSYAAANGLGVYTPQMVIDGRHDAVGSRRSKVDAAIRRAKAQPHPLTVDLRRASDRVDAAIVATEAHENRSALPPAKLLLVTFEPAQTTDIAAGENRGRSITSYNVVLSLRQVGNWDPAVVNLSVPLLANETGSRAALLIQAETGAILGAAFSDDSPPPRPAAL